MRVASSGGHKMPPEDPKLLMIRAAKAREKGLKPSQQKRRDEIDRRNQAIQDHGVRPKDGITFGKKQTG